MEGACRDLPKQVHRGQVRRCSSLGGVVQGAALGLTEFMGQKDTVLASTAVSGTPHTPRFVNFFAISMPSSEAVWREP